MGKWRCGLSDESAERTEEHGTCQPSVGLQRLGRSGGSGGSRVPLPGAVPARAGGLGWQPRQGVNAPSPVLSLQLPSVPKGNWLGNMDEMIS